MSLRIRRGTEAQRSGITFDIGELVWTTDGQKLYVGNGLTEGGIDIAAQLAGENLAYNGTTGKIDFAGASYTTDDIPAGSNLNRQYFSTESAQDAAASLLTSGVHTNISFTYTATQDGANRIDAVVSMDGVGITQVYDDTSPSLGGNLELNNYDITGTGNIDITGDVAGTSLTSPSITSASGTLAVGAASAAINATVFSKNVGITGGGVTGSTDNKIELNLNASRGTVASPTTVQLGDIVGGINFNGYTGSEYLPVAFIGATVESATNGAELLPGALAIAVKADGTFAEYEFTSRGALVTPTLEVGDGDATNPSIAFGTDGGVDTGFFHPGDGIVCITTNAVERVRVDGGGMRVEGFMKVADVAGTLPSPAEPGMIVLDGGTFKGYNGSAWVTLG